MKIEVERHNNKLKKKGVSKEKRRKKIPCGETIMRGRGRAQVERRKEKAEEEEKAQVFSSSLSVLKKLIFRWGAEREKENEKAAKEAPKRGGAARVSECIKLCCQ